MTRDETIKVLSVLKVAYPNFYKGLTKQEASAVVNLWTMQLKDIPYDIVILAVNKLISTNVFPPTIAEVKAKFRSLYTEAVTGLLNGDVANKERYLRIESCCRQVENEPSLKDLLGIQQKREALTDETHDM